MMQEMKEEIADIVFQENSYVTLSICYASVGFATNKLLSISYSDVSEEVD
jgi:hypothetical protein